MTTTLLVGIVLAFAILLGIIITAVLKGMRSGKIGPGAAKVFALLGVIFALGLFVVLMGVLKNLQG